MRQLHYDVAVIGLGAMGAATLYQMAKRGVSVVGIDRFTPPHDQGSSHGGTRITRQAVGEGAAYVPLVLNSHRIWRELEAELGVSLFEACGFLAVTSSELPTSHHGKANFTQSTIEVARANGIEHDVLDAEAIRKRFPQFAPVLDSAIGYFEPGGGYVRPERCIDAQLMMAKRLGAVIVTGKTVTGLHSERGAVVVTMVDSTVTAGKVIVCAGMWSAELLGAPFDQLLQTFRQSVYWFEVAQPSIFPENSPTFILCHGPTDQDSCYGFPPISGERSMKIATEQYMHATLPAELHRQVTREECETMFRTQVAGKIAGTTSKALKTSVCAYTKTPDFGFIIDWHPRLKDVLVISACSGHGFKHSAAIGEAVARQHVDGESDIDLSAFTLQRFNLNSVARRSS